MKIRLGFLCLLGTAIALSGSYAVVSILRAHFSGATERETASENEKAEDAVAHEPETPAFALSYELKKIAISLSNRKGNQISYAQFTLVFDCPNEHSYEALEASRAAIRSRVFEASSIFRLEDFHSEAGFARFKAELLSQLKEQFGDLAPRAIALHDWVLH